MDHDFDGMLNFNVVNFAKQILGMNSKIIQQQMELEELRKYKKMYNDLLNDSLSHSKSMAGNMIKMLMVPGVTEAFKKNAKPEDFSDKGEAPVGQCDALTVHDNSCPTADQVLSTKDISL